jgi:hypothetical protein
MQISYRKNRIIETKTIANAPGSFPHTRYRGFPRISVLPSYNALQYRERGERERENELGVSFYKLDSCDTHDQRSLSPSSGESPEML